MLSVAVGSVVAANNGTSNENDKQPPPEEKRLLVQDALHPDLPQVLHAVNVVLQEVISGDAGLLHVGEVGHAWPLVVRKPPALVGHVEAVLVLALDQRVPVIRLRACMRLYSDVIRCQSVGVISCDGRWHWCDVIRRRSV